MWYLCVLHVTGFSEAVGFHLVLVLVLSLLQNQSLYLSFGAQLEHGVDLDLQDVVLPGEDVLRPAPPGVGLHCHTL